MNERQKYINDLSIYLRQLTDEERNDALEFYDEYIADAGLETRTAIEERLGTPRQLSHKILADYSIKANNESIKEGHPASPHSSWRVFWWVLVAIITSPITFLGPPSQLTIKSIPRPQLLCDDDSLAFFCRPRLFLQPRNNI